VANSSQQYYRLKADPFRSDPDHSFSFPHKTYKKGLADLELALVGEEGFIVITGRPGTGKTTLLNEAIANLDPSKIVLATLVTTRFEAHDLWSMVASSFGLNYFKSSKSIIAPELEKFLRVRHSEGKRAFLIIDEAQRLGESVLEELQLLSNLQDDGKPLLQIILTGSEGLKDIINSPGLEDLRKQVISSSPLEPLSESETIDYIRHRLIHAGWTGDPEITKGAYCLIYHFSGGIPVIINRICNRFLLYGCAEEKHELNAEDMELVLEVLSEKQLVGVNTSEFSDLEEKINTLKNAVPHNEDRLSRQDSNTAINTSGVFNNPASCWHESTDNASAENNSCGDTRDSNDELQAHTEATAIDAPGSTSKRSWWSWSYAWLAVPAAIVIAVGLKIYSGTPQGHTQIQSQADIVSPPPAHQIQLAEKTQLDTVPAIDNSMRDNKVKGNDAKEKRLDRLEAGPERVNETVTAVKPLEPRHAKNHKVATDTAPALTEATPGLIPARTVNTAPPVMTKPAKPTGEKQSSAETKTATAPDIPAEPIETTRAAASGETVLPPGKVEPAAIDRPRAAPVRQASKPLAQPLPKVQETTESLTLAKADTVIIQPENISLKPAAKKPQKARGTSKATKTAGSASLTMDTLLANQWVTGTRQQAAQLPSFITNCSAKSGSIECWSREHFIEKNEKSVGVKTKSYLKGFTKSGFTIKYKHMLLGGANEKRRWEKKTHQLDCVITSENKIKCSEDGVNGAVIFTRNTSDQASNSANF
jgi:type II secretory pathway predicted ATPase ExeA